MQLPGQATGAIQVPKTSDELHAVMLTRAELEAQIRSLGESQSRIFTQRQMAFGDGNREAALQADARLKDVTARLTRLEDQKLAADDAITQALANGVGTSSETPLPPITALPAIPGVPAPGVPWPGFPDASTVFPGDVGELRSQLRGEYERLMILEGVVIVLIGALAWRYWFRRAVERIRREMSGTQQPAQRELKDAVDAIALEVERISEGQRFVTKLMAEKPAAERD